MQEATEEGAVAIAILTIAALTGNVVLERAAKGTGVDYWLGRDGHADEDALPFANTYRLEVSGILSGSASILARRLAAKIVQTGPTDSLCPAYITVVEFGLPRIQVEAK